MGYAFSGPDHAVAVWYELATKRYAPTAVNPVAIVGRVYAACCDRCGGSMRHDSFSQVEGHVERCRACGKAWLYHIENVPRGVVQMGRRSSGTADAMGRFADLSVVVNELDPQVGFAYGFYIVRGLGYPRTAEALNEMGVACLSSRCDEWSVRAVRTVVKRGRQALEASLEERGWLATGRSNVSLAS